MTTIWMAYAVAVVAASAVFAVAGWRSRRWGRFAYRVQNERTPGAPGSRAAGGRSSGNRAVGAVGSEVAEAIRMALHRVAPLMSQYDVRADVAVLPGLVARVRNTVLTDVIEDLLTVAIRGAPACRLLLTAVAQGDHVEVTVTDDLPNAHQAYRLGQVRGLNERVAQLGGTLHVTAHPTEGTTLAVRLAASSTARGALAYRPVLSAQGTFG